VGINGSNSSLCHYYAPCSYQNSMNFVKNGTEVVITDGHLESIDDLLNFRALCQHVFKNQAEMNGWNTVINGRLLGFQIPAFLYFEGIFNSSLHNFSFINFDFPVLAIRKSKRVIIADCLFCDNIEKGKNSILCLSVGLYLIHNVVFKDCCVENCSVISIHSSTCIIKYCNMRSCLGNGTSSNLILSVNSVIEFKNNCFISNAFKDSSLCLFSFLGYIGFWNHSWKLNVAKYSIFNEGNFYNINVSDSFFIKNKCPFLNSIANCNVNITKTLFIENESLNVSLISIKKSMINVDHCIFRSIIAESILTIVNCKYQRNSIVSSSFLYCKVNSAFIINEVYSFLMKKCIHEEYYSNSFYISVISSSILLDKCIFLRGSGDCLYLNSSNSRIKQSTFLGIHNNSNFWVNQISSKMNVSNCHISYFMPIDLSSSFFSVTIFTYKKYFYHKKSFLKKCFGCVFYPIPTLPIFIVQLLGNSIIIFFKKR